MENNNRVRVTSMSEWLKFQHLVKLLIDKGDDFKVIVYDFETTGFSPVDDVVIQCAAQKLHIIDGNVVRGDKLNLYINPKRTLSSAIVELTGITDSFLKDKMNEPDAAKEICKFFCDDTDGQTIICGYNNRSFDDEFLTNMFKRHKMSAKLMSIDMLRVVRDIVNPNELDNGSYKLCNVSNKFVKKDVQWHNASGDIDATIGVFEALFERAKNDFAFEMGTIKPQLRSIAMYVDNNGRYTFKRLYVTLNVNTSIVKLFLDLRNFGWYADKGEMFDIRNLDITYVEHEVLKLTKCTSKYDLLKFEGRIVV